MAMLLSFASLLLVGAVGVQVTYGQDYPNEIFGGVVTLNGIKITGIQMYKTPDNHMFQWRFPGIKYAKARRFEAPTMNNDYSYWTTNFTGYQCPQNTAKVTYNELTMKEDCLYLDVYTPMLPNPGWVTFEPHYPTIIFVHGGIFEFGSKDFYNSAILAQETNSIIVTINYRLGAFGFLSTGNAMLAGNNGLKDVKTAIKWVADNIHTFGGSASQITVVGHSAGAALVSAAMLDENISGLVHGAVSMSGSVLAPWSIKTRPRDILHKLANITGCTGSLGAITGRCLRSTEPSMIKKIVEASSAIQSQLLPAEYPWGMVIDGQEIPFDPYWLLSSQKFKTRGGYVVTFTKQDASSMVPPDLWSVMLDSNRFDDKWVKENALVLAAMYGLDCPQLFPNATAFTNRLWNGYQWNLTTDLAQKQQKMIQIATDVMFRLPAVYEALQYGSNNLTSSGAQVAQISSFTNISSGGLNNIGVTAEMLGAYHGLDTNYLFGFADQTNPTNYDISRKLQLLISTVAHTGHGPGVDVTRHSPYTYMDLDRHGRAWSQHNGTFTKELQLWMELRSYKCRMPEDKYEHANNASHNTWSFALLFSIAMLVFISARQ